MSEDAWISDFDVRPRKNTKVKVDQLWITKFAPTSVNELAVHKAKMSSLESCVSVKLSGHSKPFLLLTGPSGCGKTTALILVAKNLNACLQEWVNPIADERSYVENESFNYSNKVTYESQVNQFSDFLFRVNRYNSLHFSGSNEFKKKIFLVKDFPNAFVREPTKFFDIIRRYGKVTKAFPCVFIVSENEQSSNLRKILFPTEFTDETKMEVLKFNPIAPTAMMKALQSLICKASKCNITNFVGPAKEVLQEIVEMSNGDIRSAINSLHFICLKTHDKLQTANKYGSETSKNSKNKKSNKKSEHPTRQEAGKLSVGNKDTALSLFRVLGKVLHCKRLPDYSAAESQLPDHLLHYKRNSLSFDPDEVFEKSCLSSDTYIAFLHQNYLDFHNNIESVSEACDYFSEADVMTKEWSTRLCNMNYCTSVLTRGLVFSLCEPGTESKKSGWMPLHKPAMFKTMKTTNEIREALSKNFHLMSSDCTKLSTEILPFHIKICPSALNKQQNKLAIEIGRFNNRYSNFSLEKFDEKSDIYFDEMNDRKEDFHFCPDICLDSTVITDVINENNSEDFLIEEVDD